MFVVSTGDRLWVPVDSVLGTLSLNSVAGRSNCGDDPTVDFSVNSVEGVTTGTTVSGLNLA